VSAIQSQRRPYWIRINLKSKNTWSEPHREHVCQFKMCRPIRVKGCHTGFRIDLKCNTTWSGPHWEHLCQVWSISLSAILEKKFKMCQPFRGQGGHTVLDFGSTFKVTTLGQDLIRNICAKCEIDPITKGRRTPRHEQKKLADRTYLKFK